MKRRLVQLVRWPDVPPGDAAALLQLLGDRELAERMGRAGHELAMAEFSETKMVDRFVQLYRSILPEAKP